MPARWLSLSIVAFWLATTGWLFWHDLWPTWQPGQPPPYDIDLVEEAQKDKVRTFWVVQRPDPDGHMRNVFHAETWVDYRPDDDTFALHAEFRVFKEYGERKAEAALVTAGPLQVKHMSSEYRVSRERQLRAMSAEVEGSLGLRLAVWGVVHDGQFFAHYRLPHPLHDRPLEGDLRPVPVSHSGSVLMPLHPVNRIKGLRPGQAWRMPLVDPLRDAFSAGLGGGVILRARVLPEPQVLEYGDRQTPCLVIDYEGEDAHARTWVAQDSELVQRQEATIGGDHWVIQRDVSSVR
jgi:hypothetical protein